MYFSRVMSVESLEPEASWYIHNLWVPQDIFRKQWPMFNSISHYRTGGDVRNNSADRFVLLKLYTKSVTFIMSNDGQSWKAVRNFWFQPRWLQCQSQALGFLWCYVRYDDHSLNLADDLAPNARYHQYFFDEISHLLTARYRIRNKWRWQLAFVICNPGKRIEMNALE